MPVIKVNDKEFEVYLSGEKIQERVKELAALINKDYAGKRPLFIAILNGSFMFAADLFKNLEIDAEICFIKLASYKGMKSSGKVVTSIGLDEDLFGKDATTSQNFGFSTPSSSPVFPSSIKSNKRGNAVHKLTQRRQPWQISKVRCISSNSAASL